MTPDARDDETRAAEDPVTAEARRRIDAFAPGAIEDVEMQGRHPWIRVHADRLLEVCTVLREDEGLLYDCCHLVSGLDLPDEDAIEVVYHLVSYTRRPDPAYRLRAEKNDPWLAIRVRVPREAPVVPSVAAIWTGADWHERETYDLMGVVFEGHPDLRRIMLPEDWPGHPLRKDWVFPVEIHGVPVIPPEAQA